MIEEQDEGRFMYTSANSTIFGETVMSIMNYIIMQVHVCVPCI